MQGWIRKFVYVSLYEGIAIVTSSVGLSILSGQGVSKSSVVAITASVIAIVWNLVFNTLFEHWESRQADRTRTWGRRVLHAVGFEAGMVAFMLPVFSFILGVSLGEAFVMQFGLMIFFFLYTFVFNLGFDRIFGLPASARSNMAVEVK